VKEKTKEKLFVGLTAARIAQGVDLARRIKAGKPIVGATAAILAVDLLDGILARWLGADGPTRRAVDSATDSGIIALAGVAAFQKHPKARPYLGVLAARELFVASGWAVDLATSRQVKKGDDFHKLPSLSIAAFGLAIHHGSERTMKNTGAVAIAVNMALAYDYYKGWRDPNRTRMLDTGVAEVAGFYDARKFLYDIRNAPPQLEAGSPALQLQEGEIIELQEFKGEGEIPPGTYRAIPENGQA
jgi:hypothetical protein